MSNINLTSAGEKKTEFNFYNTGLFTIATIFVVLLGVYGWIMWTGSQATAQKVAVEGEYKIEKDKLTNAKNLEIVDFQRRIIVAKNLVNQKNTAYDSLPNIETSVVAGVYLKAFKYDDAKKSIAVDGVADDFNVFAKQILSFKKTDYFAAVDTGTSTIGDGGKIDFSLNLKIK